jgi:glycosyltransferase involved in cell wall biosynthesis
MSLPTISVIMPVFNGESFLPKAIESILNQTFHDFELIIINDGSTDNTNSIIEKYKVIDKRIIVKNQENKGLTKSLNIALSMAKGKYIARHDADDISLSVRFEKQIYWLINQKYEAVFSRAYYNSKKRITPRFSYLFPKYILLNFINPFIHGSMIVKKKIMLNIGGYDENFIYSQDYKLYCDLIENNLKYKYIIEPLYILNTHNNSISKQKTNEQAYYAKLAKKRYNKIFVKKIIGI